MNNNDNFYLIYDKFTYMIEHKHLKIMQALHEKGTLTEAANTLYLSQSALSHQIRYLEKKLQVTLWEREGRTLRLTQAGELLLQTAQQVLPVLEQTEQSLKAYGEGRQGILRIGVECYPCYEWLTKVIGVFLKQMPDVDIDVINKFQFSGQEGLLNHHIDILITPDLVKNKKIYYAELMEYELVLLVPDGHYLTDKPILTAEALAKEILLTFPVPLQRLDIMTHFFNPAYIKPTTIKQIGSIELMLQMVASGRGVCVLPEWLADQSIKKMALTKIRIGTAAINKKLFIALRIRDKEIAYINQFITVGKKMANGGEASN